MIAFDALLAADRVAVVDTLPSRKTALRQVAGQLAKNVEGVIYRDIFFLLQEREQESSTSLDEIPVAIPHCRVPECVTSTACLLKTRNGNGVDFGGTQVQLIFGMCFPPSKPEEALAVLRSFVTLVEEKSRLQAMLACDNAEDLYRMTREGWPVEAGR